jgi:hypothetical protein
MLRRFIEVMLGRANLPYPAPDRCTNCRPFRLAANRDGIGRQESPNWVRVTAVSIEENAVSFEANSEGAAVPLVRE